MELRDVANIRVIDGDTIELDIELGFNVVITKQKVRLCGIDTPEIHSTDPEEKHFGELAKEEAQQWINNSAMSGCCLKLAYDSGNCRDKFGRILADLQNHKGESLCDYMIKGYYAVKYKGQNKDEIYEQHLENRSKAKPRQNFLLT